MEFGFSGLIGLLGLMMIIRGGDGFIANEIIMDVQREEN